MQAVLYLGGIVLVSSLLTVFPLWFFGSLDKAKVNDSVGEE